MRRRSRSVGPLDELITDCDENDRNALVDPYVVELDVRVVENADAGYICDVGPVCTNLSVYNIFIS